MKLKLNEDFYIMSDSRNIMLTQKKIVEEGKTKGEVRFDTISYHGTIAQALEQFMSYKLRTSEATSITQLLKELEEANKTLKEFKKEFDDFINSWKKKDY